MNTLALTQPSVKQLFLNRMADAHGLDYPSGGWYPPELRPKTEPEKPKTTEPTAAPDTMQ